MAMNRVVVFGMHENELAAAQQCVSNGITAGEMVIGEMSDGDIVAARKLGLIVQVQPQPRERPEPSTVKRIRPSDTLSVLDVDLSASVLDFEETTEVAAEVDYYTLDLGLPVIDQTRTALEKAGATILAALPGGAYEIRARNRDVPSIRTVPGVLSLMWITPESTLVETVSQAVPTPDVGQKALSILTYDVRLRDPNDLQNVADWLKENHVDIAGSSGRKIRFFAVEGSSVPAQLARRPEVDLVAEYIEPELYNAAACRIVGADMMAKPGNPHPYLDGTGQIIAIADTGIDDTHPDFSGRIVGKIARGRPGLTDDPH